jgi:hypothetical protein
MMFNDMLNNTATSCARSTVTSDALIVAGMRNNQLIETTKLLRSLKPTAPRVWGPDQIEELGHVAFRDDWWFHHAAHAGPGRMVTVVQMQDQPNSHMAIVSPMEILMAMAENKDSRALGNGILGINAQSMSSVLSAPREDLRGAISRMLIEDVGQEAQGAGLIMVDSETLEEEMDKEVEVSVGYLL